MTNTHGATHNPFEYDMPFFDFDDYLSPNRLPVGSVSMEEAFDDAGDPGMFEDFFGGVENPDYFRGSSDEAIEVNPYAAPGAAYVIYGELYSDVEPEEPTAVWPSDEEVLAVMPVPGRRNNGFGGRGKTVRPVTDTPARHPIRDAYLAINHTEAERLGQLAKGKYETVDEEGNFYGLYGWFGAEKRATLAGTIQAEAEQQRARVLPSQPFARGFATRPTPLELAQAEAIMREKRRESRRKAAAAAIDEAMGGISVGGMDLSSYRPQKMRVTEF